MEAEAVLDPVTRRDADAHVRPIQGDKAPPSTSNTAAKPPRLQMEPEHLLVGR
jgi:hypothetical protein